MSISSDSFYPRKKEFDVYVASLPKDEKSLKEKDVLSLSLQAAELFNEGIPHKDRSTCLYYFYHFLGLILKNTSDTDLINQFPSLPEYSVLYLSDPKVLDYLKLLDSDKLHEVCQIRGEIKMFNIELVQFAAGISYKSWEDIAEEAESFLASEPHLPILFLENYFNGVILSKNSLSKEYEIAEKIWETSYSRDSLKRAWSTKNDPINYRAYKKATLPPKEVKKIQELENIEKEVMSEFGDNWHGRNTLGKALQFLSKRGREEKKAMDEFCIEWIRKIKRPLSFSGNDSYVNGYAAFLSAFVRGGTEDLKGAVKEFKKALDNNFDPGNVISLLVPLLDALKKNEGIVSYTQQQIDIMGYQENDQNDEYLQSLLLIFQKNGSSPKWANRLWEERSIRNHDNLSSIIKALDPVIYSARKSNIEKRIQSGIKLLDNLFSITKADEVINNKVDFLTINISNPLDEILELSIEELDPFNKFGIDKMAFLYKPTISLGNLLKYNESVISSLYGDLGSEIDTALKEFPNTLSCVTLSNKYIKETTMTGKHNISKQLAEHLFKLRTTKVEGLYNAIKPVQEHLHSQLKFQEEIEFISKARELLLEQETKQATRDLTEAYVELLNISKSLKEKDRLLKSTVLEGLQEDRLNKIRIEVEAQLNKRRKMLIRAGIILGITISLTLLVYFLFIK